MNRALNWKPAVCGVSMLLGAALPAQADVYVSKAANGDYIRLFDEPCPVTTGWLHLKRAEWFYQGKLYKACWTTVQTAVIVLDEQGAVSPIPMGGFSKETGV